MAASAIPLRRALLIVALIGSMGAGFQPCHAGSADVPPPSQPVMRGPELAAPYRDYSLKLGSFAPVPGRVAGALLTARVNGGPPLSLLLDSGAEHIAIGSRAAARSALATASPLLWVGAGEPPTRTVRTAIAETVEVGPLSFRNCQVDVAPGEVAPGIDGVIPLSLFGDFLIRLDLAAKTLALTPYSNAADTAGFARVVPNLGLLLMRGVLNGSREGYVLLDTGASYSAISRQTARVLGSSLVSAVNLQGAGGAVPADLVASGVRFQVAGQNLTAGRVVAIDLATAGGRHGVEMIGVLGYPELRNSALTVNYRDALLRLDRH
ncbi:MAG: pepsin/retropepsin-like aspartic protease family protein [Bryobacteraceae bacterium]|jgi:hypothetical protein